MSAPAHWLQIDDTPPCRDINLSNVGMPQQHHHHASAHGLLFHELPSFTCSTLSSGPPVITRRQDIQQERKDGSIQSQVSLFTS